LIIVDTLSVFGQRVAGRWCRNAKSRWRKVVVMPYGRARRFVLEERNDLDGWKVVGD